MKTMISKRRLVVATKRMEEEQWRNLRWRGSMFLLILVLLVLTQWWFIFKSKSTFPKYFRVTTQYLPHRYVSGEEEARLTAPAEAIVINPNISVQEDNHHEVGSNSKTKNFCGNNQWKGHIHISCHARASYLTDRYGLTLLKARESLLEEDCICSSPLIFDDPEPRLSPNCKVTLKDPNMSLCYFVPYGANFGDELGPAVIKRLLEYHFGCSAQDIQTINLRAEKRDVGHKCLFSLGSIFHMVQKDDHVWGTGHNPKWQKQWSLARLKGKSAEKSITVHSVRGPHTAQRLQELQLVEDATKIPLGDPGFLIPFLYSQYYHLPTRSIGIEPAFRKPDICFVPHAQDLQYSQIKDPPAGLRILTVKQHWEPMIDKLRMCDYIVSSSLHGIVVADALGIPSQWFQFPGGKTEDTEGSFKYEDYFKSIGREISKPKSVFDMTMFQDIKTYMTPLSIRQRRNFAEQFMSSFPYHLFKTLNKADDDDLKQQNRTLVIIMGSIRGGETAWESMYKNLLDVNNADLALVVGEKPEKDKTSSLYTHAKYVYEFQEYDDWADAFDLIDGTIWRQELLGFVSNATGLFGGVTGYKGSGAIIFMARWFVAKAFEQYQWRETYDRFVLTRSDHYYACQHDLRLLDPSKIWIPDGEDYGGISDRHLVCSKELFLRSIDVIFTPIRYPTKYGDSAVADLNPEQLIQRRWREEKILGSVHRFHRVMFTCAAPGDQTRWRRMSSKIKEGVYLKYPQEHKLSQLYCANSTGGLPMP